MKKILSILLVLVFVFSSLTLSASATTTDTSTCEKHVEEIVVKKASTKKNGSVNLVCKNCKENIVSSELPKIAGAFLSTEVYTYNGKERKPSVTVLDDHGLILTKNKDYTISYPSGRKKCGKYKVVVKFKGNYTGTKNLYFKITSAKTEIKSLTVESKTSLKVKWKSVKKGVTGFQIQCSTSSKFKDGTVVTKKIKGYKNTSATIKKLKKSKTYYVRIRSYNTTSKKTTYSDWSDKVKVSLKKDNYSVKKLLNSEKLNPQKTNDKYLDKLVTKTFKKIHKPGMTTYEKVKACYDYLVKNMTYKSSFRFNQTAGYVSFYDGLIVDNAYHALSTKTGVCDDYSAAFVVMCRRIGLEAYVVGGSVSKKSGGRTGHAWTYILLNGEKYIFDPQIQTHNLHVPYHYFGKTYSQMGSTYKLVAGVYNEKDFANFKCLSSKVTKRDISCKITATGKDNSVSYSADQDGYTLTAYADNYFDPPIKAYGNNFAKIKLKLSGGSGKYEILLVESKSEKIIYDSVCKKSCYWDIDLSKFKSKTNTFDLYVFDYNGDYSTYLKIAGIQLKR